MTARTDRPRRPLTSARVVGTVAAFIAGVGAGAGAGLAQVVTSPATPSSGAMVPIHVAPPTRPAGPCVIVPQVRWRHRPVEWRTVELTAVNADTVIENQVGTTTLELTLANTSSTPQEAQVVIPVPEGCSVRSMQYDGTGPEPSARIVPREEARRIYDSIVSTMKDPALLEFAGYNLIRSSVFPIPPNTTQKVRITYEQLLTADGARVDFILPRSESPLPGGTAWTMGATVKCATPISTVYSPSHDVVTERISPTEVRVRVPQQAATNPGALRISYLTARPEGDGLSASMITFPDPTIGDGKGGYFLMLTGLPANAPADGAVQKREITVVIDRSGSMNGKKIEQARAAAVQIIEGLKDGEFFNIIDFSDTIASFAPQPVAKDGSTGPAARQYIQRIVSNGGTALNDALLEALRQAPTTGAVPMVIFLTDGMPTVGERSEVKIRDAAKAVNTYQRRVFTFGVGFDVNSPLLSAIARASRGAPTFVLPEEDVEQKVSQVYRRLSGPILAAPKVTAIDKNGQVTTTAIRDVLPAELPDLFDGDQLVLLGQYTGGAPVNLRLQGDYLGKARTFDYTFEVKDASMRNAFVGRLWASRRIGVLIDQIRQSGAEGTPETIKNDPRSKELVDEVVRLSTRFGILTEYTSFLATGPTGIAGGGGALPALSEAADVALRTLADRQTARSGAAAVNQEENLKAQTMQTCTNNDNRYWNANMELVVNTNCQQLADQALFFRSNRWVDARLMAKENEKPDRTVEFGTPEFDVVLTQLIAENRQSLIANAGENYILLNNERVLVRCP
ncbi:MAG: VIT domain-containing protein [Phycisphaerales bacterium]